MKIIYLFSGGRLEKLPNLHKGTVPSEFYYGYWELLRLGQRVEFIDVVEETQPDFTARLLNKFYYDWKVLPCRTTGDLLVPLSKMTSTLSQADAIVATTTGLGFSLELLRRIGRLRTPVLTMHCGVLNYDYNAVVNWITKQLLHKGRSQVFGCGELEGMKERYAVPETHISLNEFGVDTAFWGKATSNQKKNNKFVLAVGNCGRRDYSLLIRSARITGIPMKILCDRKIDDEVPPNVEMIRGRINSDREVPDIELRELYRNATCVVVPLKETLQPSGQSVTLQAMACGTPVILSKTGGLWSRDRLVDGENVKLVPPNDLECLTNSIEELWNNEDERRMLGDKGFSTVQTHWRIEQFADKMLFVVKQVAA